MKNRNTSYTRLSPIPESLLSEAEERALNQQVFNYSHRKEDANKIGCLGEVIFEHWLRSRGIGFKNELKNTTHDYRINNLTIDVKTKDRNVTPLDYYDNSAPLYNHSHQKPDLFFFISLEKKQNDKSEGLKNFHSAYLVGSISYEELDKIGIPFLANETDWRNGTKFWTDCLNVEMWQLNSIKETIKIFKGERLSTTEFAPLNLSLIQDMERRIASRSIKPRKMPKIVSNKDAL